MFFNNYLFYFRLTKELNSLLAESTLIEAFSQEKDKIVLHFEHGGNEEYIEICVDSKLPYFVKKHDYRRAKKNTVSLFNDFLPLKVETLLIAQFERMICFHCGVINVIFFLRGTLTNILVTDENYVLLQSCKQYSEVELEKVQSILNDILFFAPEAENLKLSGLPETVIEPEDYKKYPFIGRYVFQEYEKRRAAGNNIEENLIQQIIGAFATEQIVVGLDAEHHEIMLKPASFGTALSKTFLSTDSALAALQEYIIQHYRYSAFFAKFKEQKVKLTKELETLKKKESHLLTTLRDESSVKKYREFGDLLAANVYKVTKGMENIAVDNFYDEEKEITIPLRADLSPQQNVDYYFKKGRSHEQAMERAKDQLPQIELKIKQLETRLEKMQLSDDTDIEELKKRIPMDKENKYKKDEVQVRAIKFLVDDKYTVLVGKDSRNNDVLTLKVAKPEDLWFHARGCPGSHVVLQVTNTKEPVQKSTIKKVAAIAAFYSKAKNSGLTPVAYTKKKYVTKRKGMKDGMVSLLREDVILVRPEIPAGAEYVTPGGEIEDFS